MKVSRLYTGTDNRSNFEELPLSAHPELNSLQEAKGIFFREDTAARFQGWHPAPRRQWVIILKGELEIGLGDGSLWKFGPGDARLVEDTTGQGHTTRVGNEPCICAYIPLARQ